MGSIRLLLPVAQGRLTAVGYHAAGDGSLALRPVGRQLNQGLVGRVARSLFGNGGGNSLRYYVLGGGTGPATASLDVGARARDRRLLAGRRHGRRDHAVRARPGSTWAPGSTFSRAATLRWSSRSRTSGPTRI